MMHKNNLKMATNIWRDANQNNRETHFVMSRGKHGRECHYPVLERAWGRGMLRSLLGQAAFTEGCWTASVCTKDSRAFGPSNFTSKSQKICVHGSNNPWLKMLMSMFLRTIICLSFNLYPTVEGTTVELRVVIRKYV